MRKYIISFILVTAIFAYTGSRENTHGQNTVKDMSVSDNKVVTMDYTLYTEDNKVIETTMGKQPLVYIQGKGQLLQALEDQIKGMSAGQRKSIIVKPEDAYGEVRDDFIVDMPLEKLPNGTAEVGDVLTVTGKEGKPVTCRVKTIKGKKAVLDFNHPLAGKTLRYRVNVIDVKDIRQLR